MFCFSDNGLDNCPKHASYFRNVIRRQVRENKKTNFYDKSDIFIGQFENIFTIGKQFYNITVKSK